MCRKGSATAMSAVNLDSQQPTPTLANVNQHLLNAISRMEASTRKIETYLATAPKLKTHGGV